MARTRLIPDTTLLQAILDAFQTGGGKAVSFRLIGARTGLSPAALVGRFGTGDAMLRAALHHGWDLMQADLDRPAGDDQKPDGQKPGGQKPGGQKSGGAQLAMLKALRHPHPALLAASLTDGPLAERAALWRQTVVQQITLHGTDRETAEMIFAALSARNIWEPAGGKGFRLGAMLRRKG